MSLATETALHGEDASRENVLCELALITEREGERERESVREKERERREREREIERE